MKKNIVAPWMQDLDKPYEINGIPVTPAHFSEGELEGLDTLQGGMSEDPETGIREYSKLSSVAEVPEIKAIFHAVGKDINYDGKMSKKLHQQYEDAKPSIIPFQETQAEKQDPEFNRFEHSTGTNGDTRIAWIPDNLLKLILSSGPQPSTNRDTGLLEFGFFKKILPIAGGIAGAIIGNVIAPGAGMAIGSGLGNTVGRLASGQKAKKALIGGAKTGALAYGAHGLGQMAGLGAGTAGTGGMFGGKNYLSNFGKEISGALGGAGGASSMSQGSQELLKMAGAQSSQQGGGGGMFNLDNLLKIAPLAAAGVSYIGDKKKYKLEKSDLDERKRKQEEHEKKYELDPKYWSPDYVQKHKKLKKNPTYFNPTQYESEHGILRGEPYIYDEDDRKYAKGGRVQSYSESTIIKGKGKGQDDVIDTKVPSLSYIIDASSTSGFGDGSSEAGAAVLKKLEMQVKRKFPKKVVNLVEKEVKKHTSQTPVLLSNDEFAFKPGFVTLLGMLHPSSKKEDPNKRGSDLLRKMVKNLRKDKISKGDELPPKAKSPMEYIMMGRR